MSSALADFQASFVASLFDPDARSPLSALPAFAVYRNTVMSGCVDALRANFPSVVRLVGDAWFGAAAIAFVRAQPPRDGRLLMYGDAFADFLARFEPARELRYLADVARLDRLWIESHTAADASAVDARWLASLPPHELGALRLAPHPAARWLQVDELPANSIWAASRLGVPVSDDLIWQGEGALLSRPLDNVQWQALGAGGCALLDACATGQPLAQAAEAALEAEPGTDVAALLAQLLSAGALTDPTPNDGAHR